MCLLLGHPRTKWAARSMLYCACMSPSHTLGPQTGNLRSASPDGPKNHCHCMKRLTLNEIRLEGQVYRDTFNTCRRGVETGLCVTVQLKANSITAQKATFAAFSMNSLPQRAPRCLFGLFNTRVYWLLQTDYFSGHSLQKQVVAHDCEDAAVRHVANLAMASHPNGVHWQHHDVLLQHTVPPTQTVVTPWTGIMSNSRLFSPLCTSAPAFKKLLAYVLRCIFT